MDPKTPINELSPGKCWCFICDKKHRDSEFMGFWAHKDVGMVCTYWICNACYRKTGRLPIDEQRKVMQEVENEIVSRYPEVLARLPDDWTTDR